MRLHFADFCVTGSGVAGAVRVQFCLRFSVGARYIFRGVSQLGWLSGFIFLPLEFYSCLT